MSFFVVCTDFLELVVSYHAYIHTYIHTYIQMVIVLCISPAGRHNCLWCTVRSSDLRVPLRLRGRSPARSLESLKSDHQRFVEAGSNIKNAKEFNNAIREPFFSIPLDQVRNVKFYCINFIIHHTKSKLLLKCAYLGCTYPWESLADCSTCLRTLVNS